MSITTTKSFKSRIEIAQEYGISRKTLYRKLKANGIKLPNGLLNQTAQFTIYEKLGKPNKVT